MKKRFLSLIIFIIVGQFVALIIWLLFKENYFFPLLFGLIVAHFFGYTNKNIQHKSTILILIISFVSFQTISYSQANLEIDCFSVIAGKNTTIDGSVLIAHNEDDWGDLLVNWYKVPAQTHNLNEKITLQYGATIDQVPNTYSYLWVEMPEMKFSDSYMNEWGLTIASNQCKSRENKEQIENGGIGFYLRRLMIERAKTAKEAVKIAGNLIEEYGYNYSGRTYCIADPNEAWMMAVVKGKHWIAQRIPDNEIAVIANCYTIGKIDLSDTLNFLGSKDIYDYAVGRGWYNPKSGEEFDFKEAYAAKNTLKAVWNTPRYMTAVNMLAQDKVHYYDDFPFSYKPKNKVKKEDIMNILRSHLEGTDFETCEALSSNPHENTMGRICSPGTQYGFVAQLRNNMPKEIANVMWTAVKRPCTQAFIPWYFGIESIPDAYSYQNWKTALENHFSQTNLKDKTINKAYWKYKSLADKTDKDYYNLSKKLIIQKEKIENRLFTQQNIFENNFMEKLKIDKAKALEYFHNYQHEVITSSLENTEKLLKELE